MAFLIVFIPIFAFLVASLVYMWGRVLRTPAHDGPVCGRCGAPVPEGDALSCAACGADLREAGIIPPQTTGGISPAVFIFAWTVLYGIIAVVLCSLVLTFGPQYRWGSFEQTLASNDFRRTYEVDVNWSWQAPGRLRGSGSSSSSAGVLEYEHLHAKTQINTLALTVRLVGGPPPASNTLIVAPDGASYRYKTADDKAVVVNGALDEAGIKQWFADAAIKTDPKVFDAEAADLITMANGVLNRQSPIVLQALRGRGMGSSSSGGPQIWWAVLVIATAVIVWIVGNVIYFRRRRRKSAT